MAKGDNYIVKDASSVVVVREQAGELEVLLLKRSASLSFAPNAWVFPGGKVDKADHNQDNEASKVAAIRELHEEAALSCDAEQLHYFFCITTPFGKVRFKTAFFITQLTNPQQVTVDGSEIVEACWMQPEQALYEFRQKNMMLMTPTILILRHLAMMKNAASAVDIFSQAPHWEILPIQEVASDNKRVMLYPGDGGYPKNVNTEDVHRVILDLETHQFDYLFKLADKSLPPIDGGYQRSLS